jgi:hypothetical protein
MCHEGSLAAIAVGDAALPLTPALPLFKAVMPAFGVKAAGRVRRKLGLCRRSDIERTARTSASPPLRCECEDFSDSLESAKRSGPL